MRREINFIFYFLIFYSVTNSFSQSNIGNRQSKIIKLIKEDGSVYSSNINSKAFIIGDSLIQLIPNEQIFVEADLENGRLKNMKLVQEVIDPNKTLSFEFKQMVEGGKHSQMCLLISNPFSRDLFYQARIYVLEHKTWGKTNVIPVKSGKSSIEIWPDLITAVTLSSFRLI